MHLSLPATFSYLPHQANSGPCHIWNTVYPDKYGHFEDKFAKVEAYSKTAKHIQNLCNCAKIVMRYKCLCTTLHLEFDRVLKTPLSQKLLLKRCTA